MKLSDLENDQWLRKSVTEISNCERLKDGIRVTAKHVKELIGLLLDDKKLGDDPDIEMFIVSRQLDAVQWASDEASKNPELETDIVRYSGSAQIFWRSIDFICQLKDALSRRSPEEVEDMALSDPFELFHSSGLYGYVSIQEEYIKIVIRLFRWVKTYVETGQRLVVDPFDVYKKAPNIK